MDSDNILKAVLKKLGKKYEYKNSLGGGGYSNVYLIRHTIFGEDRALKIMDYHYIRQKLKKENIDDYKKAFKDINERFINEAKLYKRINHSNIVEIHDIDVIEDENESVEIPYIIMDYIEGSSLDRILKSEAPIELRRALRISQNVLDALETIHKEKVIHRDIKPANIMIKEKTGEAILIDFGLAKDKLNETTLTSSGVTMGTPPYMSPDQLRNPKNLDYTTDIYSFGVVLYEMLTGEFPFGGERDEIIYGHLFKLPPNVRDKNPDLPVGIEDIIFKAMAKEPKQRYKSAGEFWKALNHVEETQKVMSMENEKDRGTEKIKGIKQGDEKKEKSKDLRIEEEKKNEDKGETKEAEKIKEKKDIKKERKSLKKPIKYFIIFALLSAFIAAIVAFFVFGPLGIIPGRGKGKIDYSEKLEAQFRGYIAAVYESIESGEYEKVNYYLKKAKEIKSSGEVHDLEEKLINKRREKMRKDFEDVKLFLKGGATKSKKKKKCLTFLKRHTNVPQNDDTEFMVTETNKYIKQLEAGIKADEEYKQHIAAAKESIQNKDYETAIDFLEKAKKIRDTEEIKSLLAEITNERIAGMKADFDDLKVFLKGEASNKDKLGKCQDFLNKHQTVPDNDERTSMVSETNNFIRQLQAEIGKDEQYQICIYAAKGYIKNGEYQKAIDELGKAKKIRETEEITVMSTEIREKQIEIMTGDFETLKKFLQGKATKEEKLHECQDFLEKHENTPHVNVTRPMINEVNKFISQLNAEIRANEEYNAIKNKMNISKYLAFKRKYQDSIYLPDLRNRLKRADKNLPPEKYWNRQIKKNKKGYYELIFGREHNGHLMIYIPERNIWIDRHEVSWAQYKQFLEGENKKDNVNINIMDGFPVNVTYENAEKYCKKFSLRLPEEDEWEYVAGKRNFTFPWGNEEPDKDGIYRANFQGSNDGYEGTAPVKSFEKYSSPFDVVNMAGNVWEWVKNKILKGGGYLSLKNDLQIKVSKPIGNWGWIEEGFRCIKDENN